MIYRVAFWTTWLVATIAIMLLLSHYGAIGATAVLISIPASWFIAKLAQLIVVGKVYSYE